MWHITKRRCITGKEEKPESLCEHEVNANVLLFGGAAAALLLKATWDAGLEHGREGSPFIQNDTLLIFCVSLLCNLP